MYMQRGDGVVQGSNMSWQQEIPFICSTLLHSYRILCAPTDLPGLPPPTASVLVLYTHTHAHTEALGVAHATSFCNIFCHLCSFSCSCACACAGYENFPQRTFLFSLFSCIYKLHTCVCECVYAAHSSWEIVHLHYHNGNGFDLSDQSCRHTQLWWEIY